MNEQQLGFVCEGFLAKRSTIIFPDRAFTTSVIFILYFLWDLLKVCKPAARKKSYQKGGVRSPLLVKAIYVNALLRTTNSFCCRGYKPTIMIHWKMIENVISNKTFFLRKMLTFCLCRPIPIFTFIFTKHRHVPHTNVTVLIPSLPAMFHNLRDFPYLLRPNSTFAKR